MEDEFAKNRNKNEALALIQNLLKINYPHRIDLFDNSHFAGDLAVGVKVCFEDGVANKKLYRKYSIKGDNKRDDLASMREVVYRRLFKIVSDNDYSPNLIIVDGGINQLNEVKSIINSLNLDINVAGLVKDDKHNTRALINEYGEEIPIDKKSNLFFFLMKMQDEVHRFAITSHINKRKKSLTSSILDTVEGLGEKRKEILLKAFPSTNDLRNASIEEISQYIPVSVARNVKEKLNEK
jgi:excinuclease ABC subunit C